MSKILIIDDDLSNREILRARLEMAGHEVTEAKNGEEGLRLMQAAAPDLVFLDVMMPKVDGWQVCRQIKGNPQTKPIRGRTHHRGYDGKSVVRSFPRLAAGCRWQTGGFDVHRSGGSRAFDAAARARLSGVRSSRP